MALVVPSNCHQVLMLCSTQRLKPHPLPFCPEEMVSASGLVSGPDAVYCIISHPPGIFMSDHLMSLRLRGALLKNTSNPNYCTINTSFSISHDLLFAPYYRTAPATVRLWDGRTQSYCFL